MVQLQERGLHISHHHHHLLLPIINCWSPTKKVAPWERRLILQRLSRLVSALLLVSVALRALIMAPTGNHYVITRCELPFRNLILFFLLFLRLTEASLVSGHAFFAIRAMMWYLLADSLDLGYSLLIYRTPPQLDLWFHHIVLFYFLATTQAQGMLFNCAAFLGELMAFFSGSVFFLALLHPRYTWAPPLITAATFGRKTALVLRFVGWAR